MLNSEIWSVKSATLDWDKTCFPRAVWRDMMHSSWLVRGCWTLIFQWKAATASLVFSSNWFDCFFARGAINIKTGCEQTEKNLWRLKQAIETPHRLTFWYDFTSLPFIQVIDLFQLYILMSEPMFFTQLWERWFNIHSISYNTQKGDKDDSLQVKISLVSSATKITNTACLGFSLFLING